MITDKVERKLGVNLGVYEGKIEGLLNKITSFTEV